MVTVSQITPIPISQLPNASTITGNEATAIVQDGQTVQAPINQYPQGMTAGVIVYGDSGGAPFPNFRTLSAGSGISLVDGGLQGSLIISSDIESVLPSQVGNSGKFLTTNGTDPSWGVPAGGGNILGPVSSTNTAIARWNGTAGNTIENSGVLIDSSNNVTGIANLTTAGGKIDKVTPKTTSGAYTALSTDYIIIINKAVGASTIVNLISSPATGRTYVIKDGKGDAASNNITVTPAAGNIDGASTYVINTNYGSLTVVYNGTEWSVI